MKRLFVVLALMVLFSTPTFSQRDSLLTDAIRLATEGQADSARSLADSWVASLTPSDSLYPKALYAAGVVAATTDDALIFFRRISIEYSRSEWADDALLRMSQLAFASGQLHDAIRSADRILLDYPFSDVLPDAAYWSGRAHLELGELDEGCPLLRRAADDAGENFEIGNQAGYFLQRCPGESTTATPDPETGGAGGTFFSVQIAAMNSAAAADELMRRLNAEGYDPHVVRDADGLLKVRVGRFPRRADAQNLVGELRTKFGGEPFVVEGS